MALHDALLNLIAPESPLSLVGVSVATRSSVLDFLGKGAGIAPDGSSIIGTTTLFGQPDAMGVGNRLELNIATGAAAFVGVGITLTVALQVAPDLGTPTYQPGTWQTLAQSAAMTTAQLAANTVIFRCPWLPPFPENLRPRFLSLLFTPSGAGFTTGSISYAMVTPGRDDQYQKYAARNFNV